MSRPSFAAVVTLALALAFAPLAATTVARAGQLPASISVAQQKLTLNGEGVREKYFLDLYVAGLYLVEPTRDAPAIINDADHVAVIRIAVVSKMVTQEKLVESLQEGFVLATGDKLAPIAKEIEQFRQCFADEIVRGDVFDLVYVPKTGVVVLKNGQRKGAVAGVPFKQALFGIWLGERPADKSLRTALLGGAASPR